MIRLAGPLGMQWLNRLIKKAWDEHKIANDLHKSMTIPIYKKGDKKCEN